MSFGRLKLQGLYNSSKPFSGTWRPVKIGAGGWITGGEIADDGTLVIRTDTYLGYLWDNVAKQFNVLASIVSMPSGECTFEEGEGFFEICIANSNTNIFYMSMRGLVFKTIDRGVTWTKTGFTQVGSGNAAAISRFGVDANDGSSKACGRHMAVDPADANKVLFGTGNDGLFLTIDGGASWNAVSTSDIGLAINHPTNVPPLYPGYAVAYDKTSISGGHAQIGYVHSNETGTYKTIDACSSWTKMTGGPSHLGHLIVDINGKAHIVDGTSYWTSSGSNAWTLNATLTGYSPTCVAVNPTNALQVTLSDAGGTLNQSFDGGATWTGSYFAGFPAGSGARVITAGDPPWLGWTPETYRTTGDIFYGPDGTLYNCEGIGFWKTTPPTSYIAFNWNSQSKGIEQLVANGINSSPGFPPLFYGWDRPIFVGSNLEAYPSTHGPNQTDPLNHCWDVAHDQSNTGHKVANINYNSFASSFSTDGGVNWTHFVNQPPNVVSGFKIGGSIAMKDLNNILYMPGNGGTPAATTDGGTTWNDVSISGLGAWYGATAFLHRKTVCCDFGGKFYMYYTDPTGTATLSGVYTSTDLINWTKAGSGINFDGFNLRLEAFPGKSGHLLLTDGGVGGAGAAHPNATSFLNYSIDGAASYSHVPRVGEPRAWGFGKIAPGSDYPAFAFQGWLDGVYGVWVTYSNLAAWAGGTQTWTSLSDGFPTKSFDLIGAITGDADIVGKWYIGHQGSGWKYRSP